MSDNHGIRLMAACAFLLVMVCLCAGCTSMPGQSPSAVATPSPQVSSVQAPSTQGSAQTISIKNFAFSPAALTIKSGSMVTWVNDDSAPHTVVSDAGSAASFTSPQLATGASFSQTFTQAGTYTYHCSIHPSMKGTLVVEP